MTNLDSIFERKDITWLTKVHIVKSFGFSSSRVQIGASLVVQLVNNPPAMLETLIQSLGWEDPLENG